ncbi:hypothetical protein [Actinoplanes sp. NPDC049599]|uniref:hypothetical protein n=1 Tax=Actinoplanes sp. NPDC049599 TaxID=3363903 RepID=UPI003792809A
MTDPAVRRGSPLLATLTGILVLTDAALAALGLLVWNGHRRGNLTGPESATFILLGASAAAGAAVLLLAAVALARGGRGHPAARFASGLAGLRVLAVIVALFTIALLTGASAIVGVLQTTGAVVTAFEALTTLFITRVAVRRTHSE